MENENDHPFAYEFMDDSIAELYVADRRMIRLFAYVSTLAVLIACLGLFGLAAFTTERRTKEVGIRKALGASTGGIVLLFSREFLVLVGIAFAIAVPAALYLMSRWLETFAYKGDIGPLPFVAAGLIAATVALASVAYQSMRAASSRPVKALRFE